MSTFKNPQAQSKMHPQGGAQPPLDRDPQGWGAQTSGRAAARPAQSMQAQQSFGRPLGAAQPSPRYAETQGYADESAYAQPSYAHSNGYAPDAASLDPFVGLRTDQAQATNYQYPQQSDVFGTGQYAMPQQPALSTYQPRATPAQPQAFDPYGMPEDAYGSTQREPFTPRTSYPPPAAESFAPRQGSLDTSYPTLAADPFESRQNGFDTASAFDNWPAAQQPRAEERGYTSGFGAGQGGYGSNQAPEASLSTGYEEAAYQQPSPRPASPPGPSSHWVGHDHYAELGIEPGFEDGGYGEPAQPQAGGFDQSYAEDEDHYHLPEPPRRSWTKVGVLLASTVLLGGGLAYLYSALVGAPSSGTPPLVKTAEGPFKVKPSDPGGKQFDHTDSKVMGRLGDSGAGAPTQASSTSPSSSSNVDASGARKVPVLVVNRDGTIQPPPAPSDSPAPQQTRATVAVPGLTVIDGLGGSPRVPAPSAPPMPARTVTASGANAAPIVVSPTAPPVKPKVIAAAAPSTMDDSSPVASEPQPQPKKPQAKKPAPVTTAAVSKPTGAGYVAVIASVPASDSSRIDALKQFADMQQKYGAILQNKTPEVQEANLGERGTYHRLLVGPPGSRDLASQLCSDLKGEGYSNCWVTAY